MRHCICRVQRDVRDRGTNEKNARLIIIITINYSNQFENIMICTEWMTKYNHGVTHIKYSKKTPAEESIKQA